MLILTVITTVGAGGGGLLGLLWGWRGSRYTAAGMERMMTDTPEAATGRVVIGAVIGALLGLVLAVKLAREAHTYDQDRKRWGRDDSDTG